jgi:hypothetical protein
LKATLSAVFALAAILVGTAFATPQPLSPGPGAVVLSSHPVFSWSTPTSEQPWAIYIATSAETTPEGKFYDENVEDLALFWPNEVYQWAPSTGLYAGTYWWLVESVSREGFQLYPSAPRAFTIPPQLRIHGLRVRRYAFLRNLDFELSYSGNVRTADVQVVVRTMRGKVLYSARRSESSSLGSRSQARFSWYARRNVKTGNRIRFTATVRAQGATRTITRILRSP